MKRVGLITNLGSARVARNICAPKIRVTLKTKDIEYIKGKMREMRLS